MIGWMALAAAAQAVAGPATAQVVPSAPAARVVGRVVTHPGEKVAVRVPASATYAGHERFNLYGVADAEIHVFVDADAAKRVRRLYWVQFESYLPSNDHRYNYSDNKRRDLWGATTWVVAGPRPTNVTGRPGSDREGVMRIRLVQVGEVFEIVAADSEEVGGGGGLAQDAGGGLGLDGL